MMSQPGSRKERFNRFKRPSLVEEIKDILNKYPDDGQIFKELIQNAEDAGATEIVFVYDQNDYPLEGKKFSSDGIKKLQGPCLYTYNNAFFDDNDWDGIRSLAISNKRTNPLKVGRFGLGFKSVFHLTDVPSISSGSSMAYLNPLKDIFGKEMEFLEFEETADAEKLHQFCDFACYKKIPVEFSINSNGYCNGTVFRFPLRQIESQISTSLYTHQRMENLIETFMAEGNMNLLFLKNIKQIKFLIINKDGSLEEIYQVRLDENCNQMYGEPRRQFIKKIREQTEERSFTPLNLNHCIDLLERKDGKESKHSFILSEVYGCDDTDQFGKLLEDSDLSYVPLVGIAFPLNDGKGGHVYCGLPLPLTERSMTGLPVHVNGYFSVSDDRRDLKWKTISSRVSNDKSAIWNEYLIEKLLPGAYCNLMKFLLLLNKDHNVFYSAWPNQDLVNEKWRSFLNKLYQLMLSIKCIFITSKAFWNNVQATVFLKNDEFQFDVVYLAVRKFLESTPCSTACVPAHVFKSLSSPATVNSEYILTVVQSYPNCFKSLRKEEQIDLLSYGVKTAWDVNRLSGLDVLPMVNGNYGVIKQSQENLIYIPTRDHPADVLPTVDNVLDISLLSRAHSLMEVLQQSSINGTTNLCLLDNWNKVLAAVRNKVVPNKEISSNNNLIVNQLKNPWLQRFWSYRQQKSIPINQLDGMHLIPVTVSGQKYLHEVQTNSLLMLTSDRNQHISNQMKEFLQKCGLKFVDSNALDFQVWYDLSSNEKILFPDSTGIIAALDYAAKRSDVGYVTSMCAKESDSVKTEIVTAATNSRYSTLPNVIMKLPLFKVFGGRNFTCIEEAVLVDRRNIPSIWRPEFANVLESECLSDDLLKKVKQWKRWNFEDIVQFLYTRKIGCLNVIDMDTLSMFVLKFIRKNEVTNGFLSLLKQHVVVKSGCVGSKPSALFQSSQKMQILFYGENGKFPDASYNGNDQGLIKLGLKRGKADVSSSDIANSIYFVQNIKSSTLIGMELRRKVQAILEISNNQQIDISQFNQLDWIPITQEKPYHYPRSLHWAGLNQFGLDRPNNIFAKKYTKIAGSTIKIVHDDVSQLYHKIFGSHPPPLEMVCRHLQNIVASFKEGESLAYKEMIENIYSYLSECSFKQVAENLRKTVRKVWYGNRFIDLDRVLTNRTSISVEPHYYCLSDAVPNSFHQFVKELGNESPETDIYVDVLQKLFQKYQNENVTFSSDLELSIEMIKHLAERYEEIPEDMKSLIYVPVASRFIKYCKLKDCFYHGSGGPNFSSAAEHNILHPSLNKDIAQKLGIPNLVSQVLSGDDFFEPWGQGEPLVLRLNRLLEDYEDGLAIPKELIQNADDAGATEVSFLYDERENNDLKATLFHPDMKEWQGPAFWVFNDGQFTEDDFKNITRLNAGTKNKDLTKIGKFGLGFNAVYHLTDVPSFISGQSMIIFDPHSVYLGDALKDKANPGVRVNFLNSSKDYKHFSHQFKVFHGVFGANMDFDERVVDAFPGTLFRLPLRNSSTADRSEISNLVYDSREMHELLSKLRASLNHLLLFTQNVKSVKCFHLKKNARSTTEKTLVFSVCKETDNSMRRNVVKEAASVLQQVKMLNWQHIPNEKIVETVQVSVKDQDEERKSSWLISSCIGSDSSFQFARKRSGFNPCGGVALRYEMNVDGHIVVPDVEKNQCFMFCFLPLPENSHLPVHVNGAFEVSNDRKHLVQHTSDEKKYGEVNEWNALLGGDIGEAYYNMLLWLKTKNVDVPLESWLKLMPSCPLPIQNKCIMALCKSLMVKILSRGDNLFPYRVSGGLSWTSWNLIILTNKLPPELRNLARRFINWCEMLKGSRKVCLDISDEFIHLLEGLGCFEFLSSSFISPSMFYQMVFKYIGESTLDRSLRIDILKTFISMQSSDKELAALLSSVPCIPTKPNGALKLTSDLIQADSKVSMLFELSDEVFPLKEFEEFDVDLVKLGMNVEKLSWALLLRRLQFIANSSRGLLDENRINIMKKKSKLLVHLVGDSIGSCTSDVKEKILSTAFLPVMKKPSNTIFTKWYAGESVYFAAANDLFDKSLVDIVCCAALVCEDSYDDEITTFFNLVKVPSFDLVLQQLREVSNIQEESMILQRSMDITNVLSTIYHHMEKHHMHESFEEIANLNFIQTEGGKLVQPSKVYINIDQEIDGYLYKLPHSLKRYHDLMIRLGVKEICTDQTFLQILRDIKAHFGESQVSDILMNSILHHIVPFLLNNISKDTSFEYKNFYLPDDRNIMQDVKDMVFRDPSWFSLEAGMLCVNDGIPPSHCEKLGVQSVRNSFLEQNSTGLELGVDFGQHEDLCTRIKNLLRGYANTKDVLYEILQNADDAGATEVEFIFDTRYHKNEKVLSEKWKPLQGPALLVVNNGVFTESDIKAIQLLGKGNKSTNALKTGKYGVGFNVVYNLTDCPSLLTKVDGKDDVLCIFDPNLQFVNGASRLKPGRRYNEARKLIREKFTDMKSAFLFDEGDYENKTVFRFPLRTQIMASQSKISDRVIDAAYMMRMLKELEDSSLKSLLFLNNVKLLSFKAISKEGNIDSVAFEAKPYDTTGLNGFKKFQKEYISQYGPSLNKYKTLKRFVCLQHTRNGKFLNSHHLQIFEQCGFSDEIELPNQIKEIIERGELLLVPKGAVACLVKKKVCAKCRMIRKVKMSNDRVSQNETGIKDDGDVFCTLPLPENSDLPVLINGNFVLDYETRRSLWTSNNNTIERVWNNTILTNCISFCYVSLLLSESLQLSGRYKIDFEKTQDRIQSFYKRFPAIHKRKEKVAFYWEQLKLSIYKIIYKNDLALLAVRNVKEKKVAFCKTKGSFLVYPKLDPIFATVLPQPPPVQLLQNVYIDTDVVPPIVVRSFQIAECSLTSLSPVKVRKLLCGSRKKILPAYRNVNETILESKENVVRILSYCIEKKNVESGELGKPDLVDLNNLPLCLLADETVESFSSENMKFFTQYTRLISGRENLFCHEKIHEVFKQKEYSYSDLTCVKPFQLPDFASLLPNVLNKSIPILMEKSGITIDWLQCVWKFIESEISSDVMKSLEVIKSWSLLLCQQNQKDYLLPITQGKCVLNLNAVEERNLSYNELVKSLRDVFKVFECSTKHPYVKDEVKNLIFGSVDVCENLVDAILYCCENKCCGAVDAKNASLILSNFNESRKEISKDLKVKIKKLPLFERYDGTVKVGCGSLVCLPNPSIRKEGLESVEMFTGYQFLKNNWIMKDLYKKLGFLYDDIDDFYRKIIFPAFHKLSDNAVHQHMLYIQKNMKLLLKYHKYELFIKELKMVEFIPSDGIRKCACDFFDPKNKLFFLLLHDSELLPDCYNKTEWYEFLKEIGLVVEIDQTLFIRLARITSQEDNKEKALKASNGLCRELFVRYLQDFNCPQFLNEVRLIKFIIPEKLSESLEKIHCSKIAASDFKKICFENSAPRSMKELCWTTVDILPEYANCDGQIANELGIKKNHKEKTDEPNSTLPFHSVVSHIKNITSLSHLKKSSSSCLKLPEKTRDKYHLVLDHIYQYLQSSSEDLSELEDLSLILVYNGEKLDKSSKTVLEEPIVPRYLSQASTSCKQYFQLFEKLGCSKRPTVMHIQRVLEEIWKSSSGSHLSPEEEDSVKNAVIYLAEQLKSLDEKSLNDLLLYLPTVTFQRDNIIQLTKSNEAIFVDDFHLVKRLRNFAEKVLISKYHHLESEDKTNEILMEYLPSHMKPRALSDVLEEELCDDGKNVLIGSDHISEQIKSKISSDQFLEALDRFIKHQQKSKNNSTMLSNQLETVVKSLENTKVYVRTNLKTYISYCGQKIEGSELPKEVSVKLQDDCLEIYISSHATNDIIAYGAVAQKLIKLFVNIIQPEMAVLLPLLLQLPCCKISNMLDSLGVFKDSQNVSLDSGEPSQQPGDLVPLELYPLLRNSLSLYEMEDMLAMEVDEDGSTMYVYVIVRSLKEDDCCTSQRRYGVQVSEDSDDIVYVKGYKLFKFKGLFSPDGDEEEEEEEEEKAYEEIISEIQENLWNCSGEERKVIARRLYLHWHPDKNPAEKKELANKVFQFIRSELESFSEGFDDNFQQWNARAEQELSIISTYQSYQPHRRNGNRHHYSFIFQPTLRSSNPRPAEAKRWLRQAKLDLIAMEDVNHAEWVCFLAHQTAEKSLKALQYLKHYEENHTHNLKEISASLSVEVRELACQLENLVRSSAHMRYPNCWGTPDIPHSKYNNEMACEAKMLANEIVQVVGQQVDNIR